MKDKIGYNNLFRATKEILILVDILFQTVGMKIQSKINLSKLPSFQVSSSIKITDILKNCGRLKNS